MKVGVVSDTHDNLPLIEKAVKIFNEKEVELVLHAGDYVAPFVVKVLKRLRAKLIGVFGNNDGDRILLGKKFDEIGFKIFNPPYEFTIKNKNILLMHEPNLLDSIIKSNMYHIIIYGHTHSVNLRRNNIIVFNPGEASGWLYGKPTIGIVNLDSMEVELIKLR
ncbi:MAG TPA: metallophosphoesterase [bacterium (Candidatus Stahlbacteria)]|nr:metallophosphoesterase [Candidatus Stahlbacteria bacterium]